MRRTGKYIATQRLPLSNLVVAKTENKISQNFYIFFGFQGENWICLVCHKVFCSRYVNEHMVIHSAEAQHLVTLSFSDISVWCYGCEDYVDNECLYEMKNALHKNKFNGEEMPKKSCSALVLE